MNKDETIERYNEFNIFNKKVKLRAKSAKV